ncbi:right-handed parallel beta-helix repeat-containing protein [Desmonostoc muscorum CCALA 125]|nr:right-handed parallel beta-helix repeat-containing protein [Desmonostoc muscorum CCALA 125]
MIHGLSFLSLSASVVLPWALTGVLQGQKITESLVTDAPQSSTVQENKLPNRKLISAITAAPTTYYVSGSGNDKNSGLTVSSPFRTLQRAADLTNPGDTVLIMNGEYTNAPGRGAALIIRRSGTPNAWIKFKAYPGHFPKIRHNAWSGVTVTESASYIEINGLEVIGNNQNITLDYALNQDSKGKDPLTNGTCISVNGRAGDSHHVNILNNKVHHCGAAGISAIEADYVTISNNTAYNNSWYSVYGGSGISLMSLWNSDNNQGYKIIVTNNKSYGNHQYIPYIYTGLIQDGNGIIIDVSKGYKGRVLVANNITYKNGGSGIHSHSSERIDIVHNTAYRNQQTQELKRKGEIYAGYSSDVKIFNNIMYSSSGIAVNSNTKNTNVTYDYNLYSYGSPTVVTGPNDIIADPQFINPSTGDFRVKSTSPAINSGLRWSGLTTDFLGNPRVQGLAPDRGAYEMQ